MNDKTPKIFALLIFAFLFMPIAFAAEEEVKKEKIETLKLMDGRVYKNVTVVKKSPLGISIHHENGAARVRFEDMDLATQKLFGGYDPKKARAFEEKEAAELSALETELEKELSKIEVNEKSLRQIEEKTRADKKLPPKDKARRLQLLHKKLDTLKLESAKKLR